MSNMNLIKLYSFKTNQGTNLTVKLYYYMNNGAVKLSLPIGLSNYLSLFACKIVSS